MPYKFAVFAALLMVASPALAEKLVFDHRLSPPLKAVVDGGDGAMIAYNDSNPKYVTDVIAVRGKSAQDWTEALVIIARLSDRRVKLAADWVTELRREADRRCANTVAVIAESADTVTFERRSTGCPANYPRHGLYRVVAGQRSLFLLAVLSHQPLVDPGRDEWLRLLESAHLE